MCNPEYHTPDTVHPQSYKISFVLSSGISQAGESRDTPDDSGASEASTHQGPKG